MDRLQLRLLGAPEVAWGGQLIKFRSRKELALLIYLAVEAGPHSREALMDLLWPASDRLRGQASLRNSRLRLRQGLGTAETCLISDSHTIRFDHSCPIDLDLHAISAVIQQPTPSSQQLASAIDRYRGAFLAGFALEDAPDFDHWVSQQRTVWQQRLDTLFDQLTRRQLENGESAALETTRQWLTWDPLQEQAYRRLMQLYALRGERSTALQIYEQCRRLLADELGVPPSAETMTLLDRIKDDRVTRWQGDKVTSRPEDTRSVTVSPSHPVTLSPPHPARTSLVIPFVGRATEHNKLVAAYQALVQGQPQAVCVIGEAGMGKTRLVENFLAWSALQGAEILTGRAYEASALLPYQALVDALRPGLERENAPDDLLADLWLGELSQLLPELRDRYPDLPQPTTSDADKARANLFEAVVRCTQALAGTPLILFLDDLQWADEMTLALTRYLCRRWRELQTPILLVATLRHENLTVAPALREWLGQLAREINLTRLHLQPLAEASIQQLVSILAGEPLDPATRTSPPATRALAQRLFAETAGQPFFMAETLKMLVDQQPASPSPSAGEHGLLDLTTLLEQLAGSQPLPMPATVREVIVTRLGRLSAPAASLLSAAAILGRSSAFEWLCQVAGVEELAGLTALDELLKSQLLTESSSQRQPYLFGHDKVRDVVYTEAGEARRRIYHRRALTVLEGEQAAAAELAYHAWAAQLGEPAFRYSLAAGVRATDLYAYGQAIAHYQQALDLAQHKTPFATDFAPPSAAITKLYLHLGRTLELAARYDQALATYRELESRALAEDDRALELAALLAQITPLATVNSVFNPVQSEAVAERALHLAQRLGDLAAEAKICWNQLILYRNISQLPRAIQCGERALALTRQLDLPQQMAFVLHDLGYCFAFQAAFAEAIAKFQEAIPLWRSFGNLPMLGDSLTGACMAATYVGDYDAALAYFHETLTICEKIDSVWAQAGARHNIGFVLSDRGDIGAALTVMETSIRLSEQVGFISPLIIVRADLATLYGALGAQERALALAELAVQVAAARMPIFRLYALAVLCQLRLRQGDVAGAEQVVDQMKSDPHPHGVGFFPILTQLAEAAVRLSQKRSEQAVTLTVAALVEAERLQTRPYQLIALTLQGAAYQQLQQLPAARRAWEAARQIAIALNARRQLWPILNALSQLATDPAEAAHLRQQARDTIVYLAEQTPADLRDAFLSLSSDTLPS